ncbi:glycosyltransferase family 4 protein [Blautia schinkii]|nr:glycosyltransferase family 4 protein [Blautia schinkii]
MSDKKRKNSKLNICMFGHKHCPSREGGIEIVVEELASRMVQAGHKVTCYNRSGHHVSGEKFDTIVGNEYKGICLKSVPTIEKKGLSAVISSLFAALFSAFGKYDVVHIHAEGPAAFCWLPKMFGKKVVVTIHGLDWQRAKWENSLGSKYIKFGEKMAVRYADEIIVLSRSIQQYFKEKYGQDTRLIPNGVNPVRLAEVNLIGQLGLEKDSYILYLGRIVPEKGEHYLIEAFKEVNTNKKLVIAGGASDTDDYMIKLKKIAADNDNIIFTGFVQGQMLEELYSNAYVYVLPSDLEGMPIGLLEAMSYGNCCVVSDIAECTEVIEDKAIVFERSNVKNLRKILQAMCDDVHLVQRYKQDAAGFICQKYDWNKVVEQTVKVYR